MKKKKIVTKAVSPTRTLDDLDPIEFENLIFDLMVARGMTNVTWRTPGADGGRDIEGRTAEVDLSGLQVTKKWFVECKKYANSVDWPTIYSKLAYADSHQADVLLLCTTAGFSPAAVTQVEKWHSTSRAVAIRLWPRHELDLQLKRHPDLLLKYRLSDFPSTPGQSILTLALTLSKTVSSHYSRLVFEETKPDRMLEASQALADLLLQRIEDIELRGGFAPRFSSSTLESVENCDFTGEHLEIDEPGLRAFLAYLAALSNERLKVESDTRAVCKITGSAKLPKLVDHYGQVFSAIATWADFEVQTSAYVITIRQRQ